MKIESTAATAQTVAVQTPSDRNPAEFFTKYQCGSCDKLIIVAKTIDLGECPLCYSGNFVAGYIEDESDTGIRAEETADFAEADFCVECGKPTGDIPRCEYTIAENVENEWNFPQGGYMCQPCDDRGYAEAHLDGNPYCPRHGFRESYLNMKDDEGRFIGCYTDCRSAKSYDLEVREQYPELIKDGGAK